MALVRVKVVEQHQVLSYYDTVLCSNSRLLYSTVQCWPHSMVCPSPGHEIGRPGPMVTSHTTDRISGMWGEFSDTRSMQRKIDYFSASVFIEKYGFWRCVPKCMYTTAKFMAYLESTMDTLVSEILIYWKWLGINPKQVTWLQWNWQV